MTETCRAVAPTHATPVRARLDASNRYSAPVASSTAQTVRPLGSALTPYGCEPGGSAIVALTDSEAGSMIDRLAEPRFATQMRPSPATVSVTGCVPTRISASRVLRVVSNTATVFASGLATHRRWSVPVPDSASIDERVAAVAVAPCTTCKNEAVTGRFCAS